MRPVLRGMCLYESLENGALDLCAVAQMNEALDVDQENRIRIDEAMSKQHGR